MFSRFVVKILFLVCVSGLTLAASAPAQAGESKYAAFVIHPESGQILFAKYANSKRYPASLTKMMTLYLLFEEIDAGRLTLKSKLPVSANAARQPASRLGLKAGSRISVEKAIEALVIKSANDVAVVVAEKISGSERAFARKMTNRARRLGMTKTSFRNASGLPNAQQKSTAKDLATLSTRLIQDFPEHMPRFKQASFTYNGRTYRSHNRVLKKLKGADGLKTGYTRLSGYNLSTSATRGDVHLIGIVLGGRKSYSRDKHMVQIMNAAFAKVKKNPSLIKVAANIPAPSLKPTTLAALGGQWPPAKPKPVEAQIVIAQVSGEQLTQADGTQWTDKDLLEKDDLKKLIALSDAEKLNLDGFTVASVDANGMGQGDFDSDKPRKYGIQIGAYRNLKIAKYQRDKANELLEDYLPDPYVEVDTIKSKGRNMYRLRATQLTEDQAAKACSAVKKNGGDCYAMRVDS
ncbi:MAG: D-alanyl-D-alanine carboxypeptidase [Parvularculaceae bacterium]